MVKKPKETFSIAEIYGYTHQDFKRWGKLDGRSAKYVSAAERYQHIGGGKHSKNFSAF